MSYPISITLSLALFLTACSSNGIQKPKETNSLKIKIDKTTNNLNTSIELPMAINNKNIEGKYTLEKGQISFGDIRKTINSSDLVIEKLDDDNFGFYYTVQVEEHVPDEYFGIFYYKDDKFVQKVITDGGEVSYYDNIELIKEDNRLKLTIKTNKGKRIIIWDKIDDMVPTIELQKAEKSYNGVCKAKYNELILN
jgi:hypothetical protein